MQRYDKIVIGGGAAGLVAAVQAARRQPKSRIAILERLPRAGKKLLASGNGRCNLSNRQVHSHTYHNRGFAAAALQRYDVEKTLDFFASIGLASYTDDAGRIYPMSNTAASVSDLLRTAAASMHIDLQCGAPVHTLRRTGSGFVINDRYCTSKLLLATGGKASPVHGSDGSGFALLQQLGHSITDLTPSLVPLRTQTADKSLKGLRVHHALLSVLQAGQCVQQTQGEILFTDYGISGIAAMEASRTAAKLTDAVLQMDLLPALSAQEALAFLQSVCKQNPHYLAESLLLGLLPKMLGLLLLKRSGIAAQAALSVLTKVQLTTLLQEAKAFRIPLAGTRGWQYAQVTAGGADVREFNPGTMESRLCPGLYCAGEILDVDGGCGGFNLQWAWSSGLLAGECM